MSRLAALLIMAAAVTACAPAPDTLRVERVLVGTAISRFEPFDRTITDAAAVPDLYRTVRSLPPAPTGEAAPFSCPIGFGRRYRLTFASGSTPVLVATIDADECRYAHFGPADVRSTSDSFWAGLAGALGFYTRGNDLFPLPLDMRP